MTIERVRHAGSMAAHYTLAPVHWLARGGRWAAHTTMRGGRWLIHHAHGVGRALVHWPLRAARWTLHQSVGFARNVYGTLVEASPERVIPPAVYGTLSWLVMTVPNALGITGDASDQALASVVLIFAAILATPFSAGVSLVLALPFLVTLGVAVVRHVPVAEQNYRHLRQATHVQRLWTSAVDLLWRW